MGVSSSRDSQFSAMMQRGSKTLHAPEIKFWKTASKSIGELINDDAFANDAPNLRAMREKIDVVARCKASVCMKDGGIITRTRYTVTKSDYAVSLSALKSYMSFIKANYAKIHKLHRATLNWMGMEWPNGME